MSTSAILNVQNKGFGTLGAYSGVGVAEDAFSETLTDGSNAEVNVDHVVQWDQVVPAGSNADVDARGKTQASGALFVPSKVTYWCISAPSTNTAIVNVKASAANGLLLLADVSDIAKIEPGGFVMGRCPTGVLCDATHKSLNVADAGSGGGTVTITMWGV